jgi:hypothetical protein
MHLGCIFLGAGQGVGQTPVPGCQHTNRNCHRSNMRYSMLGFATATANLFQQSYIIFIFVGVVILDIVSIYQY